MGSLDSIFSSIAVGMILGGVFALLKLPIPAPITFAGVMGIVGVWGGFTLVAKMLSISG
jgi:XapX domain-containing protein